MIFFQIIVNKVSDILNRLNTKKQIMTKKYYVAVRPQTNDLHSVHQEGCPFMPDDGKRIFLGQFNSGQDALRIGEMYFHETGNCLFCCKENTSSADNSAVLKWSGKDIVSVKTEIPVSYEQNMFCCLN
jgi:hypothetical protein